MFGLENCFPDFCITFLAIKLRVADCSATGAQSELLETVVHLIKIDASNRLFAIEPFLFVNGCLQLCIRNAVM